MSEENDHKLTRVTCEPSGMLIQIGDATRILSRKEKNELGRLVADGYSVRTMTYGEFKKLNLKLYEPVTHKLIDNDK